MTPCISANAPSAASNAKERKGLILDPKITLGIICRFCQQRKRRANSDVIRWATASGRTLLSEIFLADIYFWERLSALHKKSSQVFGASKTPLNHRSSRIWLLPVKVADRKRCSWALTQKPAETFREKEEGYFFYVVVKVIAYLWIQMSGIGKTETPTHQIWVLAWKAHSLLNIILSVMDFHSRNDITAIFLGVQNVQWTFFQTILIQLAYKKKQRGGFHT